ncbi:MAG: UbiA family prenyltransferase [Acidobacteriaceae bacterium]|nr:UbiA family prenyltransferase [Acidobacteriaceae bacterium]MBV9305690.1 UbiA family prenyltransferase [Acidobacteriaceae bacterium]
MVLFWRRLRLTLEMIKFEHSVFALPFALTGAMLAWRESGFESAGIGFRLFWIVTAMVSARSAAMTFNRILDVDIDARNRRTAGRALPAGLLTTRFAWAFTAISVLVFLWSARELGQVCFLLAPVALAVLFGYSYAKRWTTWAHLWLGLALGIAPTAAWIAMRGTLDGRILWLTAAVMFWTAGFDVIYACQDFEFDCTEGLCSIPQRFGLKNALLVARLLHVLMILCLLALVISFHLHVLSLGGVGAVGALLIYEHGLVKPHDFSRVNAAFFTVNGYVSVLFFAFWAADIFFGRKGLIP